MRKSPAVLLSLMLLSGAAVARDDIVPPPLPDLTSSDLTRSPPGEFAKEHGLPVIAANAPASVVRCIGERGPEFLAQLDAEKRRWAAADLHLEDGAYKDKFMRFLKEDGTHGAPASDAEAAASNARAFAAQVVRDDTMAESIALHLQKN